MGHGLFEPAMKIVVLWILCANLVDGFMPLVSKQNVGKGCSKAGSTLLSYEDRKGNSSWLKEYVNFVIS